MRALVLAAVIALTAVPVLGLDDPDQLVRALYRTEAAPSTPAELSRYFDPDLAAAVWKDSVGEDVGVVDFDYRYDAQDVDISGLTFAKAHRNSEARVTASFANFGKPGQVVYRLCIRRSGWRIADIAAGDGEWSLRGLLKLAPHTRC